MKRNKLCKQLSQKWCFSICTFSNEWTERVGVKGKEVRYPLRTPHITPMRFPWGGGRGGGSWVSPLKYSLRQLFNRITSISLDNRDFYNYLVSFGTEAFLHKDVWYENKNFRCYTITVYIKHTSNVWTSLCEDIY